MNIIDEVIIPGDFEKFKSVFESNKIEKTDLLWLAVEYGNLEQVKYLIENGVKCDALRHAVKRDDYDLVKFLVENGVSRSSLNDALITSAFTGNYTIINYLVENGADVNFDKRLRRCCKNTDVLNHFVSLGYRY